MKAKFRKFVVVFVLLISCNVFTLSSSLHMFLSHNSCKNQAIQSVDANINQTVDLAVGDSIIEENDAGGGGGSGGGGADVTTVSIGTASELVQFAKRVTYDSGVEKVYNVQLMNDINLSGQTWTPIGGSYNDLVPENFNPFQGTFDGNGYTVSNMTITGQNVIDGNIHYNIAFFGYAYNAIIKNLKLTNIYINGSGYVKAACIAGLVATGPSVQLANCYVQGQINVSGDISTVAGISRSERYDSSISKCVSEVDITVNSSFETSGTPMMVGGIIANISGYNSGDIPNVSITDCLNLGNINVTSSYHHVFSIGRIFVGGIVGCAGYKVGSGTIYYSKVTIIKCFNQGSLSLSHKESNSGVGGILGTYSTKNNGSDDSATPYLSRCFNTGAISSTTTGAIDRNSTGGIVGGKPDECAFRDATISQCYYLTAYELKLGYKQDVYFFKNNILGMLNT